MKFQPFKGLLLAIFTCCFPLAGTACKILHVNEVPAITIQYAATYDEVCSAKISYPIGHECKKELLARLPIWRKLWQEEGHLLLKTSIKIAGKPFREQNLKVALSLCTFSSISMPLIINARYALRSFSETPISDAVLISTIFHEVLHNYLDWFVPRSTLLLVKHKEESKGVLSHLHLLALEKATYLHLGFENQLKEIIAKDQSLPNKDYQRAWEIINNGDDYLSFIGELKSAPLLMAEPLEI